MKKAVVIIGIGEIGGVFARGFLRLGHPVYPVTSGDSLTEAARGLPAPEAVIVAVGEKALPKVLADMPEAWKDLLVLVQNELLPKDWSAYDLHPTVISLWFEKKHPADYKVIIPSPVWGPKADLVKAALEAINIPVDIVSSQDKMLQELIQKNLYILTTNIAGLKVGGTVGELWEKHQTFAREVINDVLDIQFWLAGKTYDREALIQGMLKAFKGDPAHKCMGRSAPARLERALQHAAQARLMLKVLPGLGTGPDS